MASHALESLMSAQILPFPAPSERDSDAVSETRRSENPTGRSRMLSDLSGVEKEIIFKALVHMIDSNTGTGFINADQGHPAYIAGASSRIYSGETGKWGDTPERNILFKLVSSLCEQLPGIEPDLSTWERFCSFATEAFNRKHAP